MRDSFKMISLDIFILLTSLFSSKCLCENFYLKLIADDERHMPLVFTHQINQPEKYSWYKYNEQDYIENLDQDFLYKFEIDDVNKTNTLKINDLNSNQLDHYKLKIKPPYVASVDEVDEIIYTIGLVKNLHIETDSLDYYNSTCFVNVIIPIGLNKNHMDYLSESIQKYIDLETSFDDGLAEAENERKKRNIDVFELGKSKSRFDRFVYEIQIHTPSLTFYSTNERVDKNISCELLIIDYGDGIYKKTIFKTLSLSSNTIKIYYFFHRKILFTVLVNVYYVF